ncbi:HIT domain-containing protein [Sodalis-like secondary symbiont of Drepanosiphum platanoidis]|uniref:HIT domain-containing protein n=1 Tax=Sodalis-like secondary symbiont of Drepanosiphum platanoidis TaxID=2994493 RepID=UPI00346400F8
MYKNNIFYKIIKKKIYSDIVYKDKFFTAFRDINPKAPIHILIVTNFFIKNINNILPIHENILGKIFIVAKKIAIKEKIHKRGYRLIINCNKDSGQEINYFHMHLLGGKFLGSII